jgi:outer membrane immunogenic protein
MKQLIRLTILFCACAALALTVVAGPEPLPSGKEMKQVAPAPPPECNWTGFYIGLNVGGQWGHSEDEDFTYNAGVPNGFEGPKKWGYDESGVVGGGQVGYNYQWNWVVLGVEADGGYMNLDGRGVEPGSPGRDTHGETNSDFYTTVRGRLGLAWGHWLFYATGGGIGVNLTTRVIDNCDTGNCGPALIHASTTDFDWGWTGGGGIEYMFGCHWSAKAEYLRYQLDDQNFSGAAHFSDGDFAGRFRFKGIGTEGNIVRAGLNYKF